MIFLFIKLPSLKVVSTSFYNLLNIFIYLSSLVIGSSIELSNLKIDSFTKILQATKFCGDSIAAASMH